MALRSGEGGTERRDADRHAHSLDAQTAGSTSTALMWLELAEGDARVALVERLAQARMSGALAEVLAETAQHGTLEER